MPVPDPVAGTKPPRRPPKNNGDTKNPKNHGKRGGSSTPGSKGNKNKGGALAFDTEPLNPPFDPRMRRIGNPDNLSRRIQRGWIQRKRDGVRVDFLFNPSELSLSHETFDMARSTKDKPSNEPSDWDPSYPTVGSSTGVKLLYDRTYELFSVPKGGKAGFANEYGVWADVAAWYTFLGMLPEYPTNWEDSIIVEPPKYDEAYLFVGPKLIYHGWVTGINVVYSHWTQNMIPQRCAVDVAFQILPYEGSLVLDSALSVFKNFTSPLENWGSGTTDSEPKSDPPIIPNSPTQMPGP